MKNGTSLVLLTVFVMVFGGIAGFVVFGEPSSILENLKTRLGWEVAETVESDQTRFPRVIPIEIEVAARETSSAAPRETVPVDAAADDVLPPETEIVASVDLPVDSGPESGSESASDLGVTQFPVWKTLSGNDFEANLIWVSESGKSLRFERADGSTFVYAAERLTPESQEKIRAVMVARNGHPTVF